MVMALACFRTVYWQSDCHRPIVRSSRSSSVLRMEAAGIYDAAIAEAYHYGFDVKMTMCSPLARNDNK